jgi:ferrochelatase
MIERLRNHPRYLENPGASFDFGEEKWGILFLNMGGPDTVDDVEEYLFNIFSDPHIIKLPLSAFLQRPLANFISSRRAPKVKKHYQAIGGGSPLLKWTRLVASGVQRELSKKHPQLDVFTGMRYSEPFIHKELEAAVGEGCEHIVLLSLYPQYCHATTGTALIEILDWFDDYEGELTFSLVPDWYNRPEYISLLRTRIDQAMERINDRERTKVIFSAHSVPLKLVRSGDPYVPQVREMVELVGEGYDHILTFQSRTGPVKWQGPDTESTLKRLGQEGETEVVIVPISFISDHIETLYEIDIQFREAAESAGIKNFVRIESFNDDQRFIEFLADLVEEKVSAKAPV